MIRTGKWKAEKKTGSKKVGFHMNAIYSPWVRFGDVAYTFMKSKDFPELLMNFVNSWLAEPWENTEVKMNSDKVLERQSEYEEGIVPEGTLMLTGGVDVQKDRFYYTIRAWGSSMTSWNIAHGMADTWNDIENIMNSSFIDSNGEIFQVNLCAVDSGARTDEVYEFCLINQEWAVPVKGSSHDLKGRYYTISTIDKTDSKAYGMRLYIVDGSRYKDLIAGRMNRPNGFGSWMVYKGCDREYAEQICAEEKVLEKKGGQQVEIWRPKGSHTDNHYLDCEVYSALAADLLHIRYMHGAQDNELRQPPIQRPEETQKESNFTLPNKNWINQKGRWIK